MKDAFLMSFVRDIEGRLRKSKGTDNSSIEKEILYVLPWWCRGLDWSRRLNRRSNNKCGKWGWVVPGLSPTRYESLYSNLPVKAFFANFDQGLKLSFPEHGGAGPLGFDPKRGRTHNFKITNFWENFGKTIHSRNFYIESEPGARRPGGNQS